MHRVPGPDYRLCVSVTILLGWSWCSECRRWFDARWTGTENCTSRDLLRSNCPALYFLTKRWLWILGSFEDNLWLLVHKTISIKKEWKWVIYSPVNRKLTTRLASVIQKIQIWSEFIWTMLPRESKGKAMPLYSYHRAGGGARLFWTFTLGMKNAGSVSAWGDLSPFYHVFLSPSLTATPFSILGCLQSCCCCST